MLTGNHICGRADLLPESLVGALRLFLDEVEEETEFEARFGRPLKDLTIDELCAATYRGTTIGENRPRRPETGYAPGSDEPGDSCDEADRLVTSGSAR